MIGLDTNVLLRYLTQDDPVQSPQATAVIERRLNEKNPGFVSIVAMVESVWVLERSTIDRLYLYGQALRFAARAAVS